MLINIYILNILINLVKYPKYFIFVNSPQEHITRTGKACTTVSWCLFLLQSPRLTFFLIHRLKGQIPEIKQTLEILKYMQKKKVSAFLFVNVRGPGYFRDASFLTLLTGT